MGEYDLSFEQHVDRSVEEVWRFVTTNDAWRRPFIRSVRQVEGADLAVGSRYENRMGLGPASVALVNEISVCDAPSRLAWRKVSGGGPARRLEGSYQLEPAGEATDFTLAIAGEIRGVPSFLARAFIRRWIGPRFMRQLREGVEGSSPAAVA